MKETKLELVDQISEIVQSILVPGKLVYKVLSVVVNMSKCERGAVFVMAGGNKMGKQTQIGITPNSFKRIRGVFNKFCWDWRKCFNLGYLVDPRKDEKIRKIF